MIFRRYDLAVYFEELDEALNDPYLYPTEISPFCTDTGYATVLVRAQRIREPRKISRKRHFRRFLLLNGMSEELVSIMMDEKNRILNRYDFFTEQGDVVILDYEVNKE